MATSSNHLTDRAAFERFKETHPELNSALKIAAIDQAEFVQTFASELEGGERQAHRIHRAATQVHLQTAHMWANLKDTASPFLQQTLFNNIPKEFLEQQQQIPGYDRLFGSLDYIEADEFRSVLSPAAYFVDLMRFVEESITKPNTDHVNSEDKAIPEKCRFEDRRPDLFRLRLDDKNTNDLIPYIDLVNEVLEALVTSEENSSAEATIEAVVFPQSLPLNLPLAEIRAYLRQLNWDLPQVYETFATEDDGKQKAMQRERLSLSPQEFELLGNSLVDEPGKLAAVYDFETLEAALQALASVEIFLERTGLTRQELNELVYQDLDRHEVNAGLSRLFFVNAVKDGVGQLTIQQGPRDTNNPTRPPEETLVNLSAAKLDRIYRFLKLARRLEWSFADLDWALRSLDAPYSPERVLKFDGLNDFVQIPAQTKTSGAGGLSSLQDTFTVEAWINPSRHKAGNPIICRGTEDGKHIHFLLYLNAEGRVAFCSSADMNKPMTSLQTLPAGEFSHVAVAVKTSGSQSVVQFYINGKLDKTEENFPAVGTSENNRAVNIGRTFNDVTFAGSIKDVRIWSEVRSPIAISDSRYRRLTGFEPNLAAYWPLTETHGIELLDRTPYRQHGIPGGKQFVTQPSWVSADLVLEPLPERIGATGYQFNGADQFLAARGVTGLEANQFTVEAWIRVNVAAHNTIISKGNVGNRQTQFLLWVDGQNHLVFRSTTLGSQEFRSASAIAPETFIHVAVTVSAEEICLYLNGRLDVRNPRPTNTDVIDPRGDDLTIGNDFSERYFNGVIQEVRIWNYSRSIEAINSFMHRAVPSLAPGLIGYWPLTETSAELAADLSVNGNHLYRGGIPHDFRPDRVEVAPLLPELPLAVPGTALQFDGDQDRLVLCHDTNFGLGRHPRFTLEFWFKPTEQILNPEGPQLLFSQGDGEAGLAVYLNGDRLVAVAWCADYELTEVQETVLASSEDSVIPDQWHHVAIVHDEIYDFNAKDHDKAQDLNYIEFRGFLNGAPLEEISSSLANSNLTSGQRGYHLSPVGVIYLGGIDGSGMTRFQGEYLQKDEARFRGFSGQMADLRLWNVARTAAAIDADRYRAPSLDTEGLIAYLPLDEGQDITVTDRVNGYTGDLQGNDAVFVATPNSVPKLKNRYTHYAPESEVVLDWSNYIYSGLLYVPETFEVTAGGLGVTFLSRHPEQIDQFYRLQVTWTEGQPSFGLAAHPQGVQRLTTEQGEFPAVEPGTWYTFRIHVTDDVTEDRTNIAVSLWPDGTVQPGQPQVIAYDDSDVRITAGAVGLWTAGDPPARFNNLHVVAMAANGREENTLLSTTFKHYEDEENPTGWVDTGDSLTSRKASDLFSSLEQNGKIVLATDSSQEETIHTYYYPKDSDALDWSNYSYRGKLRFTEEESGIGLTFLSRTPAEIDQYYALQRDTNQPNFHLVAHPLGVQPLNAEPGSSLVSEIQPKPGEDYFVLIEVETLEDRTQIRAKIWAAGEEAEPDDFQIYAYDDSDIRIQAGTVGVRIAGPGTKTFKDLTVLHETLLSEDFSAEGAGENWLNTGPNNSSDEDKELFQTVNLDGDMVFSTESTKTNIHSHYQPAEALDWTSYTYTGRMLIAPDTNGDIDGIGVTFFSRYTDPAISNHDQYYRLRRYTGTPTFHVAPHPHNQRNVEKTEKSHDTGVNPEPNTWYRFLIEAHDTGSRTLIRAKVWKDGEPEPAEFQADTFDDTEGNLNQSRLTTGTIGLWAGRSGQKYFDDLKVRRGVYLSADLPTDDLDQWLNSWHTTGIHNAFVPDDALFVVKSIPDHPIWADVRDLPLLRQPLNLNALRFDGSREYLALESLQTVPNDSFTLETWIQPGTIGRVNPVFSWGEATWFGLNAKGRVTLVSGENSLSGETTLATDAFSHIAVTVDSDTVTVYVNGAVDGQETFAPTALAADTVVEVGRSGNQYFGGQIRDLRLWNTVLSEFPVHQGYQKPDLTAENLLAYWAFGDFENAYTLDSSAHKNRLRLGGLEPARKPTLFERDLATDNDFFQSGRSALTFSSAEDGIGVPAGENVISPKRHTAEIWVKVNDPHITQRKQVIYHTGDDQQGLVIYVHDGRLYFGHYHQTDSGKHYSNANNQTSTWQGTWLQTDRILAHRWHHVALVLDGRAEVRPRALRAYLDGKLVDMGAGVQLSTMPTTMVGAAAGALHFHDGQATAKDTHLAGALLELRLWNTARTSADIAANRYVGLTGNEAELALWWQFKPITTENPEIVDGSGQGRTVALENLDRLEPLEPLTTGSQPSAVLNADTLIELATCRQLMERHRQSVEQLTALWYDLRYTGRTDNRVFFDRVFNPAGLMENPWGYHDPARRWDITGQELPSRDRAIRSRLMGALQLSSDDLNLVVALASGTETPVEVDTAYLGQLYRLTQTPRVLRLTLREYLVVLGMIGLTGVESLEDLALVSDRITELRRIGVSVDELNFLANDVISPRIRPPYSDATIRGFADEVVNQSVEFLVTAKTFASDIISESQSETIVEAFKPTGEDRTGTLTTQYFVDDLGAVSDRYQSPEDLKDLAIAQNWAAPFTTLDEAIAGTFKALESKGFVNEYGIILRPEELDQFPTAFDAFSTLPNPTVLAEIQAVLEDQKNRQNAITETLTRYRDEHRNAILAGLSELLGVEPEPLQAVITYFQSTGEPLSDPAHLLTRLMSLQENQPIPADLLAYLFRLYKVLFLVVKFALTTAEIQVLLADPECFSVGDVYRPSLEDLVNLFTFTVLKTAFGGDKDQLVQLLKKESKSRDLGMAILDIGGWDEPQLTALIKYFGAELAYNRVENLIRLQRAFALAEQLRVDAGFLLELSNTDTLSIDFYRQQADALLPALRALYDDEQWPHVYRPLRDPLVEQKRDALLALAMEAIPDDFEGRRSPDLLSEYFLLDVQVSSAVETSRIVQGTAALQQYVQRCLMNLETGVNPASIPTDQWGWMQNYRVWEANRKVFLYPESYIEPELRDTKTPLFEELELELMQNDINVKTSTQAFNNYLHKLAELTNLKIIGTYLHRDVEELFNFEASMEVDQIQDGGAIPNEIASAFNDQAIYLSNEATIHGSSPLWRIIDSDDRDYTVRLSRSNRLVASNSGDSTLYLLGRSATEPRTYYYREWVNETQWLPWKRIDLAINAEFVTPVFAFNRLFLFWVEFTETPNHSQHGGSATTVYRPTIRYSFPDFNGNWSTSQVYAEVDREITKSEMLHPEWQRVYALRSAFEVASLSDEQLVFEQRERILVIYGDTNNIEEPINVHTLRNARDQEQIQLQFRGQLESSHVSFDMGLTPPFLGPLQEKIWDTEAANFPRRLDKIADGTANTPQKQSIHSLLKRALDASSEESEEDFPEMEKFTEEFRIVRAGEHPRRWFLSYNTKDGKAAQVDIRIESSRLLIYRPVSLYLGYIPLLNQSRLNDLATGNGSSGNRSSLSEDINDLIKQRDSLKINENSLAELRVEKSGEAQWFLMYKFEGVNRRLLIRQEENQLNVYRFSHFFLRDRLNAILGIDLGRDYALEDRGNNHWLITNPKNGRRFLLVPQGQRQVNVYQFTSAILYTSEIHDTGINDYALATAPVELTPTKLSDNGVRSQVLLEKLPLAASLLDINNQSGWYILDTGEEQFLLRADINHLATDAERLVFPASNPVNSFTFQADPLLQGQPKFKVDRLDTTALQDLGVLLFQNGLDGLLSLNAQRTREIDFSTYLRSSEDNPLDPPSSQTLDFRGAYGVYYREIFFHIPFFIANQLNANQNFADAQRWYHYIFNPTSLEDGGDGKANADRYWQYLPFRNLNNLDLESLASFLSDEEALAEYREDPFDPHAIARLRINAYQKAVVMKYIDNLLDWGDNLFAQETREAINQAFLLYVLAFNLLGPRPEPIASGRFQEIGDYQGIREAFEEAPEFLTELNLSDNAADRTSIITLNQNGNIITTFYITENADFIGFWDRVEDRLFKIRHSLNMEGTFRQLDLFQPSLDVRALVRAFASGNRDIGSLLSDLNRPVPHYRYSFMLERAKEMIGNVKDFGAALLEALEKRDAEQLAVLQTTHERNILELMTRVQELEIQEAQSTLAALQVSRDNIQNRLDHFDELVDGGIGLASLSDEEITEIVLSKSAQGLKVAQTIAALVSANSFAAPDTITGAVGPGLTTLVLGGGSNAGRISGKISEIAGIAADIVSSAGELTGKIGEYKRRLNGWTLERDIAKYDLKEVEQQMAITELQIQRAEQELLIHERTLQNNQEVADFYRRKFTNEALYNWMISRLSGLYFQAYKLAYDFAKAAERALQYELPTNERFINFGHWDNLRRGLLAGESLLLDVSRMEKFHLDNDSRFQEIEKIVPLSRVSQNAFEQLLENGECNFSLTEALFNRDYPGHYFRVIKSIALSLKFADDSPLSGDPYFTVNATLTQVGNKTLLDPDINAVHYLMGIEGATQPNGSALRVNWRSNQQIAVSKPRHDNGMFGSFDLNFVFDDRYFPFEGTGAVSNWHLEIPKPTNPELVEGNKLVLEDVIIHIQYTSKFDRGDFKNQVQEEMKSLDQNS